VKNLFNEIHLEEMKARIEKLDSESVARWGKFSVQRMVIELLDQFFEKRDKDTWPIHTFFGRLSGPAWAGLIWRHFNHHLSQFGV